MSELRNLDPQGRDVEGAQAPRSRQPSIDEISEAWEEFPEGYPRYAAFIAHDVDKSTTIFRRFERLAARNLLYLESELFELEARQDKLDENDWNDLGLSGTSRKWEPARKSNVVGQNATEDQAAGFSSTETGAPFSNGSVSMARQGRLEVAYSIRKAIKEYYKALKLYREILSLDKPNPRALRTARLVLDNHLSNNKNPSAMLEGRMASHLDGKYKRDLCLAGPAVQQDNLTTFVEQRLGGLFRDTKHPHRNIALMRFPRRYIQIVVAGIGLVVFVSMFLGSLFLLYFLRTGMARLAMISCMTLLLTTSMAVFTRSSKFEIFAAVIGYLLITTVFVGNSPSYDIGPSYSDKYYPVVQPSVPASTSDNTTSTVSALTLTTMVLLAPAATTATSSDQQPSAALGNSASIATIVGVVIAALALLLSVVAGIYQCRK